MTYTFLWRLTAVSWNEKVIVFSLEVTLERVCWPSKWNMKKRKSVKRRSIYRKYVSWSRLQKRGTKFKWGRSFKHWPRGSPGQWFSETEYLRASTFFVSGTSGITSILNYRSVSPIDFNIWVLHDFIYFVQWNSSLLFVSNVIKLRKETEKKNDLNEACKA